MAEELQINQRISLKDVFPGWTDKHYVDVKPMTFEQTLKMRNLADAFESGDKDKIAKYEEMLTGLFIGGKGLGPGDDPIDLQKGHFTYILPRVLKQIVNSALGREGAEDLKEDSTTSSSETTPRKQEQ